MLRNSPDRAMVSFGLHHPPVYSRFLLIYLYSCVKSMSARLARPRSSIVCLDSVSIDEPRVYIDPLSRRKPQKTQKTGRVCILTRGVYFLAGAGMVSLNSTRTVPMRNPINNMLCMFVWIQYVVVSPNYKVRKDM